MHGDPRTIWEKLDECVSSLSDPFRASEIVGWFRRHYPEVQESSLRVHIQSATSNSPSGSRGGLASRPPLITRIAHGVYVRAKQNDAVIVSTPLSPVDTQGSEGQRAAAPAVREDEWHTEARVQSLVVRHLAISGWSVLSVADTATKEHGIDVVAEKGSVRVGVEVKGYPSRFYADPARAHETKPTQPATQARVWFAGALLAAMKLRTKEPAMLSVIALPNFTTYRSLQRDVASSLERSGIDIWWVHENGDVEAATPTTVDEV